MDFYFFLFDRFESLDLFGPVEIFGSLPDAKLHYVSMDGGIVTSAHSAQIVTEKARPLPEDSVLLVPGGMGTRPLSKDSVFLEKLKEVAGSAGYVLSVCTGSALLAAAGLLPGTRATSNKFAFDWACSAGDALWVKQARWVRDGRFYTSSGVSAGIDMALGFVSDTFGSDTAEQCARRAEYVWNDDPDNDPFCPAED